jgi:xanthine dehydrogenase large subunit
VLLAAVEANSFLTAPERMQRGDAEGALGTAPHRLEGELFIGSQEHFYLETQAAIAYLDEGGGVSLHSSTQHPAETQEIVARVLGVPKHAVTVQCVRMGGAFGGKEVQANLWAAVAALGAIKLGRPVRVRLTRHHDMTMTGKRHPFLARFRVGFEPDGRLTALALQLYSDGGYSTDLSAPIMMRALFHVDNCYLVPNLLAEGRVCRTHHVSHTAFRGFGGPQGMLVIEDIIDRVARQLGLPPEQVRAHNFYRPGDVTHYGQPVRDAARITRIWDELRASSEYAARRAAIAAHNQAERHTKRGLAITPLKFGISFTTGFFNQAGALVLLYKDGSCQVNHGGTEMGQGLHTKIRQIAADALGIPTAQIRVMPTRTDKIPNTSATAASTGTDLNGAAVKVACDALRTRLLTVAARKLGCDSAALAMVDGQVTGPLITRLGFAELCSLAYLERVPLFEAGYYRTPDIHFDPRTNTGKPFHYYAYGAAVSEVEVDGFTGQYRLLRTDILHDAGSSISPQIDRGQVEGGFLQGVGYLTREELVWDDAGALVTSGASTYKLPASDDMPPIFNVAFLTRAEEPGVVHGAKAVGEPPLMLAISVREALRDAVAAFGPLGVVELASPATPEAVYWAIARQRARS